MQDRDVVNQTLWEPESKLLLRVLDRVRAVDDVAANVNAVHATDGAWVGGQGVGGADDLAGLLHHSLALQGDGDDRARGDVLDQGGEEGLGGEVSVVTLSQVLGNVQELEATQDVALESRTFEIYRWKTFPALCLFKQCALLEAQLARNAPSP